MVIGNIEFKHGLFLAPMAGLTDHAFRAVCKMQGVEGVCSELVSAKAAVYQDQKTGILATVYPDEQPAAIQIFGSDPLIMAKAAEKMLAYKPAYIDINMGCPVPKLYRNGEGSALMNNPALCGEIVREVARAVPLPVTVKIRKGPTSTLFNAPEVAAICEQNGAAAVFVHGRTRPQMYSGKADREIIRAVKETVKIPVIGNGDIASGADALNMIAETGCDGVMVGRGAHGKPWVFAEILAVLEGRPFMPPNDSEIKQIVLTQLQTMLTEKSIGALPEARGHLYAYIRSRPGAATLRARLNTCRTLEEVTAIIEEAFGE